MQAIQEYNEDIGTVEVAAAAVAAAAEEQQQQHEVAIRWVQAIKNKWTTARQRFIL